MAAKEKVPSIEFGSKVLIFQLVAMSGILAAEWIQTCLRVRCGLLEAHLPGCLDTADGGKDSAIFRLAPRVVEEREAP